MPEDTKAKAEDTSAGDGKNTEGAAAGAGTQTAKAEDADKKFTQADLDRIAGEARKDEREKARKAKEQEDRARQEKQDEAERKFEKLATERKAKLDEVEPQLEQYKSKVAELAAAELAALPDEVKDIAPAQYGEDGKTLTNPLDVLAWLPKGKALAAKLEGQPAKPGAKEDPKPKGQAGDAEADKRAKSAQGAITRSAFG